MNNDEETENCGECLSCLCKLAVVRAREIELAVLYPDTAEYILNPNEFDIDRCHTSRDVKLRAT